MNDRQRRDAARELTELAIAWEKRHAPTYAEAAALYLGLAQQAAWAAAELERRANVEG